MRTAFGCKQAIAALRDHHRVDDEVRDAPGLDPVGDGVDDRRALESIPVLIASAPMSSITPSI